MTGPFRFAFFQTDSIPDWHCPACSRAPLELVSESFTIRQTARARKHQAKDEGFSPDEDENIFNCLLRCTQKNCMQPVAVSGDGYYEQEWSGSPSHGWEYVAIFRPRYFYPPLTLFTPCDAYPPQIKSQLLELSAQLPGHRQAAVNDLTQQ